MFISYTYPYTIRRSEKLHTSVRRTAELRQHFGGELAHLASDLRATLLLRHDVLRTGVTPLLRDTGREEWTRPLSEGCRVIVPLK